MKEKSIIGVVGATSLVGRLLLQRLNASDYEVTAFTRGKVDESINGVNWQQLAVSTPESQLDKCEKEGHIPRWICVAPLWVLQEHFSLLEAYGIRRIVVLSSTSRFTKVDSSDLAERETARRLVEAEEALCSWASQHKVEWVILRPTLIYGMGCDKNISEMAKFIRRFGFFPLFGKAEGLRQPIHAADVSDVCVSALLRNGVSNRAYNISGDEVITYREMVSRIFITLGQPQRILQVPLWLFRFAIVVLSKLPRYQNWNSAMAARMNSDMAFQHSEATRDLGFKPRRFMLSADDLQE